MNRRGWAALALWLLGAATFEVGCGEEGQLVEGADSLNRGDASGVPVVFRVDYPDIYGPIDVQVRGAGNFTLAADEQFDCEQPAFFHEGGTLEFGALSSRFFAWRDVVVPEKGGNCLVIDLTTERLRSDVLAFGIDFPWYCYPYSISYGYGPHEVREVWTVKSEQKMHVDTLVERAEEHGFIALIDEARKGRLALLGGGYALVETVLRARSIDNPNTCPESIDNLLSGLSPLSVRILRAH